MSEFDSSDEIDDVVDEDEMDILPVTRRKLTNEDITKYDPMVDSFIRDSVVKNWNEASTRPDLAEVSLGNTGLTIADIKQYLRTEVCVALMNYNPEYRTDEGKTVKESTFVYGHLWKRIGSMMRKLTKKGQGYGIWMGNIEEILWEVDKD